jgi:HK97 family phage major capsid protein
LRQDGKLLTHEEYKSLNSIVSTEGGYLVAPQYSEKLLKKAFDGRQLALNVMNTTIGSNVWKEYIDTASYDNGVYVPGNDTTPSPINSEALKEIQIQVGEQYFGKKFHRSTLEDSFVNLEVEVMDSVMGGMLRLDADGVLNGLGTSASPLRGLLTYASGTSFGQIERVTSATNDAFGWDDVLEKLPAALSDDYHGNAKFCMRRATFFSLLTAKDSQNKYQIGNQISFLSTNVGVQLGIIGYPVLFDAGMPAVANGALAVAFGDFEEAYRKVNRVGFSIHRNDSDPQWVTLTGRSRVGGGVKKYDAVKLLVIQ